MTWGNPKKVSDGIALSADHLTDAMNYVLTGHQRSDKIENGLERAKKIKEMHNEQTNSDRQ